MNLNVSSATTTKAATTSVAAITTSAVAAITTTKAATSTAPAITTTKAATTSASASATQAGKFKIILYLKTIDYRSIFTATTTQKATTTTPLLAFETIYKNFFSLGLANSDLTATQASFTSLLTSLSVNTAQVTNYVAALKAYLAIVVATPTQVQKDAMTAKLNLFDAAEVAFIESFQGLANIGSDPLFSTNLSNADFNTKRSLSSAAKSNLKINPQDTYGFFSDPATATAKNIAEYTVAAIAVSDRIKAGR